MNSRYDFLIEHKGLSRALEHVFVVSTSHQLIPKAILYDHNDKIQTYASIPGETS